MHSTIGDEKIRITLTVSEGECFNYTVYLLCFTRKADFHKQLPKSNIQWNPGEIKLI
jgi:hypothetical protein